MNSEILSYVTVKYANKRIYYNLCQINNDIYICCINGLKYFAIDNRSFNNITFRSLNIKYINDIELINSLKQVPKLKTLTIDINNNDKVTDAGLINGLKQVPN